MEQKVKHNVSPFLRWAGGKTWLLKHIHKYLPKEGFNSYHEPFLGGGSIFFSLQPEKAFLSDLNKELVDTYKAIQQNVESVIQVLKKFTNSEESYYQIRDKIEFHTSSEKAARFIFLNQTSFNGIYRVNLNGKYNVPFGFRKKDFFQPENLRIASRSLKKAILFDGDFSNILTNLRERDLVFLDPPYTVSHYNNGFIKYNSKLFSEEDQIKLAELINEIKRLGCYYIMTNADHEIVHDIFKKNGDHFYTEERASLIGGRNAKRGIYKEAIYTNIIN